MLKLFYILPLILVPVIALDCFNTQCFGTDDAKTSMFCDQSSHNCSANATTGLPICTEHLGGGAGINCTGDEFFKCSNSTVGDAVCEYPPTFNCYNEKCFGTDGFSEISVDCDQSKGSCAFNGTGYPSCEVEWRGDGVNCTGDEFFRCSQDDTTGTASCSYPATFDCYNTRCAGSGVSANITIFCDQLDHVCGTNATTGEPTCESDWRGTGVNCSHLDQYYCDYLNGSAVCEVPANYSCYDTACNGHLDFVEMVVECDQSVNRCIWNNTGFPTCKEGTRGHGSTCYGKEHLDYYCGVNDTTHWAVCNQVAPSSCYGNACQGTGSFINTTIACDVTTNSCQVNAITGEPICSEEFARGVGVNCTGTTGLDYYCSMTDNGVTPLCVQTPPHSCYEQRCWSDNKTISIPCDGSRSRCEIGKDGGPICVATSRGQGIDCNTKKTWYCGYTGQYFQPSCLYTDKFDCFNTMCYGAGSQVNTTITCDQSTNRCGVNKLTGEPTCEKGNSGSGIMCGEGKWRCASDKGTGVAVCVAHKNLIGLWVAVVLVLVVVAAIAAVLWLKRKRQRDDRVSLISREI